MSTDDVVRTVTIKTVSDGAPQATKDLQDLAAAQQGVAVASDTTSKSTLSAASALNKLQNQLDPSYRSATQLNNAQTTLGKAFDQGLVSVDRYNQLMALASTRFDAAGKSASPLAAALTGVKTQMVALSAGLGPVGVALASLGPIGLAAGAAFGVASAGFALLKDQANEAGQWAQTLQQSADIIGLNTTQIQALNEAAAQVGVSANDNVSAFEKFSVALGQLKDGSGTLYTELLKVNPQLVNQLSVTKDSATAWNLLAQAYSSANAQQQALITRAAFGRGGAAQGQVLLSTAAAGGIGGLVSANQEDAISQSQIKQWADLTTQINSATEAAQHNFQSIFTTDILASEKAFADNLLNISRYAKDFTLSDDLKSFLSKAGSLALSAAGTIPFVGPVVQGVQGAASLVSGLTTSGFIPAPSPRQSALPPAPNFDATFGAVSQSNNAQVTASLGVQAAAAKAMVSALGSAATAQDKLDATTKQLNLDLANGKITQDTYNKAVSGANLDAAIAKQSLYNSALGELATTSDLVAAKSLALQKDQQQGAGLTTQQITAVKNLTAANDEWTRVNGQSQIGVFNLAAATKAAGDQFQSWIDKKYLDPSNPEQYGAALQAMANKIQAASDAAKVAGSAFPQLAQLGVDAGNINKQFDTFATTSLNAVSPALQDMLNGVTSLSAGFQSLGLTIVKALENMIIQLVLIKPLATSLSGLFGVGGLNLSGGALPLPGSGSFIGPVASAKGNIFSNDNLVPFANGGSFTNSIVNSPTLFKFASGTGLMGEAGPEAIVPLKRGSDGSLGIASTGGSGGGSSSISFGNINISVPQGTDTGDAASIAKQVQGAIGNEVAKQLRYHMRPRGMLNSVA